MYRLPPAAVSTPTTHTRCSDALCWYQAGCSREHGAGFLFFYHALLHSHRPASLDTIPYPCHAHRIAGAANAECLRCTPHDIHRHSSRAAGIDRTAGRAEADVAIAVRRPVRSPHIIAHRDATLLPVRC